MELLILPWLVVSRYLPGELTRREMREFSREGETARGGRGVEGREGEGKGGGGEE